MRGVLAALVVAMTLAVTPGHADAPATAKSCTGSACTFTDRVGDSRSIPLNPATPDPKNGTTDLLTSSLVKTTLAGKQALKATYVVNGILPVPGVPGLPLTDGDTGWSFRTLYADTQLLDNVPIQMCTRLTSPHPVFGTPTYVYQNVAHWLDGYRLYIDLNMEYLNGTYVAKAMQGFFDPSADGGFGFVDPNSDIPPVPPTKNGKGTWFDYSVTQNSPSAGKTTVTVTVVSHLPTDNVNCQGELGTAGGNGYWDFALPGSTILAVSPTVWANRTVSGAGGTVRQQDNLSWGPTYGGQAPRNPFGDFDAYYPGIMGDKNTDIPGSGEGSFICDPSIGEDCSATLTGFWSHNLLTGDWPGPTCWSPTFGGTLPPNPLHTPHEACAIQTPLGWGEDWSNTGAAFTSAF